MRKFLLKILFITLMSLSSQAIAEQSPQQDPPKEEQTDFFDLTDAPVSYKGAFVKMMLTLLALLALIVLSVWMLRRISHGRMKQMNYGRSIKVVERRPLSAKSILYLVEIEGKKVVIAESQNEIRAITTSSSFPIEES